MTIQLFICIALNIIKNNKLMIVGGGVIIKSKLALIFNTVSNPMTFAIIALEM